MSCRDKTLKRTVRLVQGSLAFAKHIGEDLDEAFRCPPSPLSRLSRIGQGESPPVGVLIHSTNRVHGLDRLHLNVKPRRVPTPGLRHHLLQAPGRPFVGPHFGTEPITGSASVPRLRQGRHEGKRAHETRTRPPVRSPPPGPSTRRPSPSTSSARTLDSRCRPPGGRMAWRRSSAVGQARCRERASPIPWPAARPKRRTRRGTSPAMPTHLRSREHLGPRVHRQALRISQGECRPATRSPPSRSGSRRAPRIPRPERRADHKVGSHGNQGRAVRWSCGDTRSLLLVTPQSRLHLRVLVHECRTDDSPCSPVRPTASHRPGLRPHCAVESTAVFTCSSPTIPSHASDGSSTRTAFRARQSGSGACRGRLHARLPPSPSRAPSSTPVTNATAIRGSRRRGPHSSWGPGEIEGRWVACSDV